MASKNINTKLLVQNNGYNAQSKAIYFDGTGDYLSVADSADWDFGTGDFTLEAWFKLDSSITTRAIIDVNGATNGVRLLLATAGIQWEAVIAGTTITASVTTSPVLNKWYHVAFVRSGTTVYFFQNGKQIGTTFTNSGNITGGTVGVNVGRRTDGNNPIIGWMKNVRVSNSARYTADFTPSVNPFTADANTKLLILADESVGTTTFTDSETTPKTITTNGDCKIVYTSDYRESNFIDTEATSKLITDVGTSKILSYQFNKSAAFFDGSSFIQVPDSADWDFGTGDFTLEANVLFTSIASTGFLSQTSGGNTVGFLFAYDASLLKIFVNGTLISATFIPVVNTWYHVAVSRSGTSLRLFVDGLLLNTTTNSTNITGSTGLLFVGRYGEGATWNLSGWMKEVRISNSARYTATFTPSSTQFASDANTKLLLHFDTPATAPISPAIKFDGTGDYLSVADSADWDMQGGDFTIEMWVRFNSFTTATLIGRDSSNYQWRMYVASSAIHFIGGGASTLWDVSSGTLVVNRWYHIAGVRNGSSFKLYVDGVSVGTPGSSGATLTDSTDQVTIGSDFNPLPFNGWMKQIRVSKGTARYTTNFTPSQTPFVADTNTKLLILGSESNGATTFTDSETTPKTITTNGDTKISYEEDYRNTIFKDDGNTGQLPFGSSGTKPKIDFIAPFGSGSTNLDGSGSWLTLAANTDFAFGTGDFTVEAWFRVDTSAISSTKEIIGTYNGNNTSWEFFISSSKLLFDSQAGIISQGVTTLLANTWYHGLVARSGSTIKLFLNGTQEDSDTNTTNFSDNLGITIGNENQSSHRFAWFGQLDNVVVIKGTATKTATFNPPSDDFANATASFLSFFFD